ncbi:MAG: TonB family protein [Terriglobales bacterium]
MANLYPLPPPDLTRVLGQHIATAFSPDLAFDLVLNELVVRAADATGASTAAIALLRGDEMVCRAATGPNAPGLGVPVNTRDGLSGACMRTHAPQLCDDTESDPRVDAAIWRRLGVRSMLVVPVFDERPDDALDSGAPRELAGVFEVLSPLPSAFSEASQSVLEEFAREASNVRRAADQLRDQIPAAPQSDAELLRSFEPTTGDFPDGASQGRQPYEGWTLLLGALVIFAAISVSFMVGSRVGWLRPSRPVTAPGAPISVPVASPSVAESPATASTEPPRMKSTKTKAKLPQASTDNPPPASSGELVVYDKGKVIFRMKPPASASAASSLPGGIPAGEIPAQPPTQDAAAQIGSPIVPASSKARMSAPQAVWLAPDEAENRLLSRVEPQYPAAALAAHLSGRVVLEINVAENGTVSSVRTLIGDPVFGAAAAEAVRTWRYQPYRAHDQPSRFRTDVSLTFSAPN